MTGREIIAKAIHDGPEAVYQHWKDGIPFHEWEDCPYQRQYLADADAVLAAGAFTAHKPEPLKIGDVLETVEDLRRFAKLPAPAFATDRDGDGWCSVYNSEAVKSVACEFTALADVVRYAPFTIRYIPGVGE